MVVFLHRKFQLSESWVGGDWICKYFAKFEKSHSIQARPMYFLVDGFSWSTCNAGGERKDVVKVH